MLASYECTVDWVTEGVRTNLTSLREKKATNNNNKYIHSTSDIWPASRADVQVS